MVCYRLRSMIGFRKILFFSLIFGANFGSWIESAEATRVGRELDCGQRVVCLKLYYQAKSTWLKCLERGGVPEKKRGILALKVERLGIRNLKKTEFLIFNSRRKNCHKIFSRALSRLENNSDHDQYLILPRGRLNELIPDFSNLQKP